MEVETSPPPSGEIKSNARSCTTCAKAKAKCVKAQGDAVCERCSRLKKECHLREPVVRKRKVMKTTRAAQLEKLENKLESLVSALSTSQGRQSLNDYGQPSPPVSSSSSMEVTSDRRESFQPPAPLAQQQSRAEALVHTLCQKEKDPFPSTYSSSGPSPSNVSLPTPDGSTASSCPNGASTTNSLEACPGVSMREAELLVDRYRRLMSPALPFVPIRREVTARALYQKKPFLLHSICCVASFHDLSKQQTMIRNIMRDVSERMLINNEKSIDLLQGIMIVVAWYHPHVFWLQQITNLLHLASAMLKDMAIDRNPQAPQGIDFKNSSLKSVQKAMAERNRDVTDAEPPAAFKGVAKPANSFNPQAFFGESKDIQTILEEHRCLAGVFYLTSTFACSFRKCDALRYTFFLDNCLETLDRHREYESDPCLVQMTRLQRVCEEIHNAEAPGAPFQLYAKAFQSEIAQLKRNDAPCSEPMASVMLELQFKMADVLVWELALVDLQEGRGECMPSASAFARNKPKKEPLRAHLDSLYECITSIRRFLDSYFAIPSSLYLTLPFHIFAPFAHCFILATRLASLEMEGWDFKALNSELDYVRVLDEAADRFDASTKCSPDNLQVNNDCFNKWSSRMRWMKQMYEGKFNDLAPSATDNAGEGGNVGSGMQTNPTAAPTPTNGAGSGSTGFMLNGFPQGSGLAPPPSFANLAGAATLPDDVLSGDFFSYLDDSFWQSFAGDNIDLGGFDMNMGGV